MKKALFCLLLAVSAIGAYAQEKLDGVWGIPFGATRDEIKQLKSERASALLKDSESDIIYENCPFGTYTASLIQLKFSEGKFYSAIVLIDVRSEPEVLNEYRVMKEELIVKYGEPDIINEEYYSPYKKGDGHEAAAVRSGDASIGDTWYFPKGKKENAVTRLMTAVNKQMTLYLYYDELATFNKVAELKKNKVGANH